MTPTALSAFTNELTKTAKPGLGTMLGQNVTKTVKVKAKQVMKKKAGVMEAIKGLLAKGKDGASRLIKKHPGALVGGAAGGLAAGEDHRMQGMAGGALVGHFGNKLGRGAAGALASTPIGVKRKASQLSAAQRAARAAIAARNEKVMMAAGLGTAGLGSALIQSGFREKTAGKAAVNAPKLKPKMGVGGGMMEQPAMGTGKGIKKKIAPLVALKVRSKEMAKKAAEDAGDTVQDVLSEMMQQSQYQPEPQEPFWADQSATSQEGVEDPAYGHGKGLKGGKAFKGKQAPPFTDKINPTDMPQAFGKKSLAKKASDIFFGKAADVARNSGLTEQQAIAQRTRAANQRPVSDRSKTGISGTGNLIVQPLYGERHPAKPAAPAAATAKPPAVKPPAVKQPKPAGASAPRPSWMDVD